MYGLRKIIYHLIDYHKLLKMPGRLIGMYLHTFAQLPTTKRIYNFMNVNILTFDCFWIKCHKSVFTNKMTVYVLLKCSYCRNVYKVYLSIFKWQINYLTASFKLLSFLALLTIHIFLFKYFAIHIIFLISYFNYLKLSSFIKLYILFIETLGHTYTKRFQIIVRV